MIRTITALATRRSRLVLVLAALALPALGLVGGGVKDRLSVGGFVDPTAESTIAAAGLETVFGTASPNYVLVAEAAAGAGGGPGERRCGSGTGRRAARGTRRGGGLVALDDRGPARRRPQPADLAQGPQGGPRAAVGRRRGRPTPHGRAAHPLSRGPGRVRGDRNGTCRGQPRGRRAGRTGPGAGRADRRAAHPRRPVAGVPGLAGSADSTRGRPPRGPRHLRRADRPHPGHDRVDLRTQPHHRVGARARRGLQPDPGSPVPRGAGRRPRRGRRGPPHGAHRRPDRLVQRCNRRTVPAGATGLPRRLPAFVRLRGRRGRHHGGRCRSSRGPCVAGPVRPSDQWSAQRCGARRRVLGAPGPAGDAPPMALGAGRHRTARGGRAPVPLGGPRPHRRPGAADRQRSPGRGRRAAQGLLSRRLQPDLRRHPVDRPRRRPGGDRHGGQAVEPGERASGRLGPRVRRRRALGRTDHLQRPLPGRSQRRHLVRRHHLAGPRPPRGGRPRARRSAPSTRGYK